jgi:F1F0 ATPase subunit 2
MTELGGTLLAWTGAWLAGGALGLFFFSGLWWTVRRAARSATPAGWFIASLVLRTALVLLGFYGVGAQQPARMGLCLLGFVLARAVVLRATRPGTACPPAAMGPACD